MYSQILFYNSGVWGRGCERFQVSRTWTADWWSISSVCLHRRWLAVSGYRFAQDPRLWDSRPGYIPAPLVDPSVIQLHGGLCGHPESEGMGVQFESVRWSQTGSKERQGHSIEEACLLVCPESQPRSIQKDCKEMRSQAEKATVLKLVFLLRMKDWPPTKVKKKQSQG